MSKKPAAALSANLVALKGEGAPSADMPGRGTAPRHVEPQPSPGEPGEASGAPLNFRVPETFRREFKIYAAQHGLKLNELLRLSFEAYRRTNGG